MTVAPPQPTDTEQPPRGLPGMLAWLVFPVLLVTTIGVTLLLLETDLPTPAVTASVLVGLLLTLLGLERVVPLHPAWNRRPERADVLLLVGNRLVDVAVIAATLTLLAAVEPDGTRVGLRTLWPRDWPLVPQAFLGIAIAELIRYALHRLSHRPGLLGRIHRVHHEPGRMYVLNGPRLHPGNQLWITLANVIPMSILGAELDAMALLLNITVFFVVFQHANVRLRFDGFNRVFATPDAHRLHHVREHQVGHGANYGIVLMVFDQLFGTWVPPGAHGPRADGIGLSTPSAELYYSGAHLGRSDPGARSTPFSPHR